MTPELKQALNTIQNECQKNNECDSCTLYAAGLGCRVTLVWGEPVVRCKYCLHGAELEDQSDLLIQCRLHNIIVRRDDYCSLGKKR